MSKMSKFVEQLAAKGKVTKEAEIGDLKVVLRILSVEEQLLSESIIKNDDLRDKYGVKKENFRTMTDTFGKYRTVATLCFAIESINGVEAIDTEKSNKEQFEERMEFMEELFKLNVTIIDYLMKAYHDLTNEHRDFFTNPIENAGK